MPQQNEQKNTPDLQKIRPNATFNDASCRHHLTIKTTE